MVVGLLALIVKMRKMIFRKVLKAQVSCHKVEVELELESGSLQFHSPTPRSSMPSANTTVNAVLTITTK